MHRLPELEHDVVGHVDDGGQRAHTAAPQALRHPQGTPCLRSDAAHDAADVARATLGRVERDGQDIVDSRLDRRRRLARHHRNATRDGDLASDSGDAQAVTAIRSEAYPDDDILEPEPFGQIRPERRVGFKLENSIPILSDTQLLRRAQHAL